MTFISVLETTAGLIADEDSYLHLLAQAQRLQIRSAEESLDPADLPERWRDADRTPSPAIGMPACAQTGGSSSSRSGT